jgi:ABC-type lipoprotein release transport system permease subunit
LTRIDLEEHSNRHQVKLSKIVTSISDIKEAINSISQNHFRIIKNFKEFEQKLVDTKNESGLFLKELNQNQEKATDNLINKLNETDAKLDVVITQNEKINKDLDFIKKIGFVIALLVIISIIFNIINLRLSIINILPNHPKQKFKYLRFYHYHCKNWFE